MKTPCAECPWRTSNWDRDDPTKPEGFYGPEKRSEMWGEWKSVDPTRTVYGGHRFGTFPICHKASPIGRGGLNPKATHVEECAAATALVHRELLAYHDAGCDLDAYQAGCDHPPLTLRGLAFAVALLDLTLPTFAALTRDEVLDQLHPLTHDHTIDLGVTRR